MAATGLAGPDRGKPVAARNGGLGAMSSRIGTGKRRPREGSYRLASSEASHKASRLNPARC